MFIQQPTAGPDDSHASVEILADAVEAQDGTGRPGE
jgi:hypothetical protein